MSKKGRKSKAPVDPAAPVDPNAPGAPAEAPKASDKPRKRRSKPKIDKRASEPVIGERPSEPVLDERPSETAMRGDPVPAELDARTASGAAIVNTGAIVSVESAPIPAALPAESNVTTGSIVGVEVVAASKPAERLARPAPPTEAAPLVASDAAPEREIAAESAPASMPSIVPVDVVTPAEPAAKATESPPPAAEPSRPISADAGLAAPVVPIDAVAPTEPASVPPENAVTEAPARPSPRRLRPDRSSDEHIERPQPDDAPVAASSGTPIEPLVTTSAEAPLFTPVTRQPAELPADPELLAKAESPATALAATVAEASAPPERAPSNAERAPSSAERAPSSAERASSSAERADRASSHPDGEHTAVPARVGPSAAAAALEAARIVSEIVDIDTPTGAVIAAAAAAGAAIEVARADAAAAGTTLEIVRDGAPPPAEGSSGDPVTTVRLSRDRILRALDEPVGLATPVPRAPTHPRAPTQPGDPPAASPDASVDPAEYDEPEFFDPVQLAAAAIQRLRQRARSDLAVLAGRSSRLDILVIVVALALIVSAGWLHARLVTPRTVGFPFRPQVVFDACKDKPTKGDSCTTTSDCDPGQVCNGERCVATCEFQYGGQSYAGTCDTPPDDPPECHRTGATSAGFPDHGLAFRHSAAWLGPDAVPSPPPRLVHDLALTPAQQESGALHVELTSSVDPVARIELLIDKKPAWSNIVTGLDLDRRSRWGELYTLDDSEVKSIEGHQWLRTEYRYAHSSEKGDVPRVDRAIEYATIDRDQIYVVTLFGSPGELERIESVVAPTLRVATPSALPLVPQTGHLGQRTFPTEVEHAFDSTVMVVVADVVDGRLKARGGGSGIIVGADGSILTNYHVVHDKDGRLHDVFVIGRLSAPDKAPQLQCAGRPNRSKLQRELDLALIKCDLDLDGRAWNPQQSGGVWPILDPLEAKEVKAGQRLWVIGYPDVGGGGLTLYQGQVEGWTGENGTQGTDFIKTDAPISNGNSGGPVVDDRGRLVGIASAYRTKVTANGGFVQTAQVGLVRPIGAASDLLAIALAGWTPREGHTDVDLAPSAVEPAASGIHISTRVLDTSNEAPVRDALVMVLRPGVSASAVDVNRLDDQVLSWGRSNAAGDVLLKQPVPVPGNYTVMVVARGYEPLIGEGELHLDANAPANFDPWGKIWLRAR